VGQFVSDQLVPDGAHLGEMPGVGDVHHGYHLPAKFVEVTGLALGAVEILQAHAPAVVLGANFEFCWGHGQLPLSQMYFDHFTSPGPLRIEILNSEGNSSPTAQELHR
jgi:hypothetical protein